MTQFSYALQKALHSLLTSDSELSGLISGVFDFVPAKTAYPYVTLGDMRSVDESTATSTLVRLNLTLHVYSRERGRKEAHEIMQLVYELLHDAQPVTEECRIVSLRYQSSQIELLRDGLTYHGRVVFSCFIEPNAE